MSCQSNSGVLKSEDIAAVAQELGKDLSPEELAYVATRVRAHRFKFRFEPVYC